MIHSCSTKLDLHLNFYHPLCYNSTAIEMSIVGISAILAGAHSYLVVSSFKCEGNNSCDDLIPNPRIIHNRIPYELNYMNIHLISKAA